MTLTIGKEADTITTAAAATAVSAPALRTQPPPRPAWTSHPDRADRATRTTRTAGTEHQSVDEHRAVDDRRLTAGPLAARVELREEGAVISLSGLLVAGAIAAARTAVDRAAALGPRQIIVDLGGVRAIDPSGAVLLGAMSRHAVRRGCLLHLCNAGLPVRQALTDRGVQIEVPGTAG
ncbi:STAS domain-containing protein [Parafrankia elaeagni]|uniref:STAS domain-containing protein n=1 Tax=Parafrankia elaeagni TaxID=222534 RepID=UPI00035F66A9|nr:STAS domain-containing protein [Parafrankia elaeagni]